MRAARLRVLPRADPGTVRADRRHAARVAAGLLVPGAALLAAGRPDLIIYAAFGSFTGMYGRAEPRGVRLRHQAQAGAILFAGVALGVLLSVLHAPAWVLVCAEAAFSFAGALVTTRLDLTPRGPFFGIFALGAVALVPAGRAAPWTALGICAGAILLSVLIGLTGGTRGTAAITPVTCVNARCALVHAVRYAGAIAAAGAVGLLLGVEHANWAMASAAVPLAAADPRDPRHPGLGPIVERSVHRVLGTFVGLAVTASLLLPGPDASWSALAVIVLLFPTELFMARHYWLALGFFTPLIMVMTELAAPGDPVAMVTARAVDTVVGVVAGVGAAVIVRGRCR
ncbi:Fusaric acid resistance protein family protein [Actinomadura rubteroloni]|uniref:Fusaric acid resistance protein family protein n=1 Tax=Actinomadura rubteroloni TaxID=1926885 RepID=A0A2P4UHP2_9ACTN|nr:FUSC family protein [Actinomadura rubteroloni]POM24584.1 Fusaric acid resistance protein family protein [Actinomadura rubteroloni]